MPRTRTTTEIVRASFAAEGYELLSEYVNRTIHLNFVCAQGHTRSMTWANWAAGCRCGDCNKGKRKLSQSFIESSLLGNGYQMLSDYVDSKTPFKFLCPQGHYHQIAWADFGQGKRCGKCSGQHVTIEEVRASFEKQGYALLAEFYVNASSPLAFICPKGHRHQIAWANWKGGQRCGVCTGMYSVTIEAVKESFESHGYQLLATEYVNNKAPLRFICPEGHEHQMTWASWARGNRCGACDGKHMTTEFVASKLNEAGYELLSEYVGANTKFKFRCDQKHDHQMTWCSWRDGHRCGICAGKATHTIERVREIFRLNGLTLTAEEYVVGKPLAFTCPRGHHHKMSLTAAKDGQGCNVCTPNTTKRTIEHAKECFEARGFTLISDKYKNSHSALDFVCDKGHEHKISLGSLKQGVGCGVCNNSEKRTIEYVGERFASRGFTLLPQEYKDAGTPLDFICDKGHEHKISLSQLQNNVSCGLCFQEKIGNIPLGVYQLRSHIYRKIDLQLKGTGKTWRDFYREAEILEIANEILPFYQNRSRGMGVDHFIPCSWFDLTIKNELVACWSLGNLRRISHIENVRKGNRMNDAQLAMAIAIYADILAVASKIPGHYQEEIAKLMS